MTLPPQLQLPLPSSFTFHIALNLTLQVCAFLLSMSDKLVAKGVFPFRGLRRVPEKGAFCLLFSVRIRTFFCHWNFKCGFYLCLQLLFVHVMYAACNM